MRIQRYEDITHMRGNADRDLSRSKVFLFFLYLGMLAVTSRSGPLLQRQLPIFTMSYGTILLQSMPALEI
jgi:hypothetical protein